MADRVGRTVLANMAVVGMATVVTAVAGLVADDVLPVYGMGGPHFVWYRWVILGLLLVVLFLALYWRSRVHRTTGTLFQVQLLDEEMLDLREESRAQAERGRMAVRSITRWVDMRCRRTAHGVIDVVDLTQNLADILEEQINGDLTDTGYTVAPVLPWPMALAIGTQLPLGKQLRLQELQDRSGKPINEIVLDQRACDIVEKPLDLPATSEAGRVGVWIALTSASVNSPLDRLTTLGVTQGCRLTLGPDLPTDPVLSNEDLAGLGAALAAKLAAIRNAYRDRELVVVAMMPKIVALATGWHLAHERCRFFDRTYLLWFDTSAGELVPMRVKESQPLALSGRPNA